MTAQQDLQELLRLLTVARKVPMMQAMAQIKALQAVELRSIKQIAESPLATVQSAITDDKAAKTLHSACKAAVKRGDTGGGIKRIAPSDTSSSSKRAKKEYTGDFMNGPVEMTPQQLESSLKLPLSTDEGRIAETAIQTNRAPLVLAFAVELLRYTMTEQPLSSRLSLAQAVVSANSRSKAVNIGLEKGPSADEEGWGEGQPRVKVMGREIAVLKRSGYEWHGEETVGSQIPQTQTQGDGNDNNDSQNQTQTQQPTSSTSSITTLPFTQAPSQPSQSQSLPPTAPSIPAPPAPTPTQALAWSTSAPITLKSSTFVARAHPITTASSRPLLIQSLLATNPSLKTATHNAWAYRIGPPQGSQAHGWGALMVREDSFDDGETGCGDLMLRVMRELGAVDTLVVLTRWFGGTLLGPDRWRLMRNCVTGALTERMRMGMGGGGEVRLGGEAVWGLDLEAARKGSSGGGGSAGGIKGGGGRGGGTSVVGMHIHSPQGARTYLLKSFATPPTPDTGTEENSPKKKKKSKTQNEADLEKEENLGLLLGALRIVFDSWADHLTAADLDRRAWAWYTAVRPEVESGPGGWGAKGVLKLKDILDLRRGDGA